MQMKLPKNISAPPLPMEGMFILDQCALIETMCAELYRHFAGLHAEQPELAKLWRKTALEEDHHASQFQMLSRMKGEGLAGLKVDLPQVTAVLKKMEALFEQVRSTDVSPADALKLAIKLEDYLSQYHANSISISRDPELTNLLNAMMNIDRDHVARLEAALARLTAEQAQAEG